MNKTSHSSLYMIELIIAILFFMLASAASISFFAHAKKNTIYSKELSGSVLRITSAAETVKAVNGNADKISSLLLGKKLDGKVYVYYNNNFEVVDKLQDMNYILLIETNIEGNMLASTISIRGNNGVINQIEVKKYLKDAIGG